MIRNVTWPLLTAALCGCASTLSGIGGTDGYACRAPEGALCTSMSGVYANASPPRAPSPVAAQQQPAAPPRDATTSAVSTPSAAPGHTLRSSPQVLRLWIAPWEDADGDLHEEAVVHVVVDHGRWLIEHLRPATRARIDGVIPPAAPTVQPTATNASEAPAPTRFPIPPGELPNHKVPAAMER